MHFIIQQEQLNLRNMWFLLYMLNLWRQPSVKFVLLTCDRAGYTKYVVCVTSQQWRPQSRERGMASTTYLNQTQLITCNFMLGNVDHAANKAFSICNVNALCTPILFQSITLTYIGLIDCLAYIGIID